MKLKRWKGEIVMKWLADRGSSSYSPLVRYHFLPEAVSFKSHYTIQHYKWKSIIESYMFTFR
jgi:hypothetical protein